MSKYSAKDKISKKLEDSIAQTNAPLTEKDDLTPDEIAKLTPEEFDFAEYDETAAERAGYSNYSYWRSTIRVFFKNKVAVTNLVIMLVLVLFTFLQPLLPNQFDPNLVNKFDEKAVWLIVDEDGKAKLSGIKYTKGDYAAETDGRNTTLAYVQAPEDWGNIKLYVQEKGGVAEEIAATADSENPGWYYAVISAEKPYMYVTSEDGEKTTYFQACWITVDAETMGVTSSSSKQTSGELIADVPEGCVLTYLYVPQNWGTPKVMAGGIMRGSETSEVEFTPLEGEGNEGWYYAFVNSEQMMLEITSENGEYKGMNKGVARVTDPTEITPQVGFISNQRPNEVYWFGTNDIGQDLWSRMWSGTRTSLFIGIVVAAIEAVVGILVGLLWGYVRKLDFLFTEIYNVINNIPSTIILILASYVMRPSVQTIIIAMSLTGWIGLARFIRNQILIIRDRDYNVASRTPPRRVIMKNLLPQMVSVVMLRMSLAIPGAIGSEVFLAYIGLGLPISIPSLGNLVNKGRSLMMAPSLRYQLIIPAVILSIITVCFYLVGNAFSDAADPKNHV